MNFSSLSVYDSHVELLVSPETVHKLKTGSFHALMLCHYPSEEGINSLFLLRKLKCDMKLHAYNVNSL